jgi:hypothetical protein
MPSKFGANGATLVCDRATLMPLGATMVQLWWRTTLVPNKATLVPLGAISWLTSNSDVEQI